LRNRFRPARGSAEKAGVAGQAGNDLARLHRFLVYFAILRRYNKSPLVNLFHMIRQIILVFAATRLFSISPPALAQAGPVYADVAPIFQSRCVMCHSGQAAPAGLNMDSLDAILKGSSRGPVVRAGSPETSELVHRIKGSSLPRMPMTGPPFLSASEISTIEGWIAGGLQPGDTNAAAPATTRTPQLPAAGEKVTYLHVAPIFATRCAKCHARNGLQGPAPEDYRLTSYESTLASTDRARVVPGNPGASELLRRVRGQSRPRMPLDGPPYLSAAEIKLIEDWISQGAANAEGVVSPLPVGAKVRLHGTLDSARQMDGLVLVIGSQTRIDKNPRPGSYVQVRGRIDAAGQVIVDRLRRR